MANPHPKTAHLTSTNKMDKEALRQMSSKGGKKGKLIQKRNKQIKLTLADIINRFLTEKFNTDDGEILDGQTAIVRKLQTAFTDPQVRIDELSKLLSVMNNIMQGQASVMNQINVAVHQNNWVQDKDRLALFDEVMGNTPEENNNEPVDVEFTVEDKEENGNT